MIIYKYMTSYLEFNPGSSEIRFDIIIAKKGGLEVDAKN